MEKSPEFADFICKYVGSAQRRAILGMTPEEKSLMKARETSKRKKLVNAQIVAQESFTELNLPFRKELYHQSEKIADTTRAWLYYLVLNKEQQPDSEKINNFSRFINVTGGLASDWSQLRDTHIPGSELSLSRLLLIRNSIFYEEELAEINKVLTLHNFDLSGLAEDYQIEEETKAAEQHKKKKRAESFLWRAIYLFSRIEPGT